MTQEERRAERSMIDYMAGWTAGASGRECTHDMSVNNDARTGFATGRSARLLAVRRAMISYGVKLPATEGETG